MSDAFKTQREALAERRAKKAQERDRLRASLEADCGTAGMPQKVRDLMWRKAWEDGHSEGKQAILMHYDDLADIAKAAARAPAIEPEDDARDGVLFRFWIRAGSYPGGWPGRLSELFREHGPKGKENVEPRHYRAALMALAKEKGVNLP